MRVTGENILWIVALFEQITSGDWRAGVYSGNSDPALY